MSKTSEGLTPEAYGAVSTPPQAPMEHMGVVCGVKLYFADSKFIQPGIHAWDELNKKNIYVIDSKTIKIMYDRIFNVKKLNVFQRFIKWLCL